jgi:hypothetical protein
MIDRMANLIIYLGECLLVGMMLIFLLGVCIVMIAWLLEWWEKWRT